MGLILPAWYNPKSWLAYCWPLNSGVISHIPMSVDLTDPYQSPSVPGGHIELPETATHRGSTIFIPPILAIGFTLVFLLGLANVLWSIVASFNKLSLMAVWSSTLFFSVSVLVYLIIRVWPRQLSPVSMGVGFVLFGVVLCLSEGYTSPGTDIYQMSIMCGTLVAMVFVMTRSLDQRRPLMRLSVTETDNLRVDAEARWFVFSNGFSTYGPR